MTIRELNDRPTVSEWTRRYLAFLGVEQRAPSLGALTALTRAHVATVPFANVTAILRRRGCLDEQPVPPIDPGALLDDWERHRGGGVCFEIAGMFGQLLGALGYQAHPVLGQISFPGSHQAVLVALDNQRYLVDVGCGAPLFEPIALSGPIEVRRAGLAYRFRADDTPVGWVQDRWIDGAWSSFCRYALVQADPEIQEQGYQRHHTLGLSWVVDNLRLVRCTAETVYSLRDDEFSCHRATGKQTERVSEPAGVSRLVSEIFGLAGLRIEEILEARAELTAMRPH